jgi:DNA-binding response OmpR family regulator
MRVIRAGRGRPTGGRLPLRDEERRRAGRTPQREGTVCPITLPLLRVWGSFDVVRVLLLEDDVDTAQAVSTGLALRGYEVAHAADLIAARRLLGERTFDVAVLDVMVPGGSGYDVLRDLRSSGVSLPVLMLTARDRVEDRIEGLRLGADDYLVKPFAFLELAARIEALMRRPATRVETIRVAELEVDPMRRRALYEGTALDLTPKEFELLVALASQPGHVLTRKTLLEMVWGYRFDPGTNVVDVHVTRLRRKLESVNAGHLVRTVRGVGYTIGT